MDHDKNTNEFTVQGRDTPVPVGVGSARAGSSRPSSYDCSEIERRTEEVQGEKKTGAELDKVGRFLNKMSEKRRRLNLDLGDLRSSSAPNSPGANVATLDFSWSEEEARSVKKRKEENSTTEKPREGTATDKMAKNIRAIIWEMDSVVRTVHELAKERNTKREIKEAALKMRSLSSRLMTREAMDLLQTLGRTAPGERDEDLRRSLEEQEKELRQLRAKNEQMAKEMRALKGIKEKVNEKTFKGSPSFEKYKETKDKDWPRNTFRAAYIAEGSPLRAGKDADILLLDEEDDKTKRANIEYRRALYERYPEIADLDSRPGTVTAVTIRTAIKRAEGDEDISERWIFRVVVAEGEEEWFDALLRLRDMMEFNSRKKIAIYPPGADEGGRCTRLMAEYLFHHTGIKVIIYTRKREVQKVLNSGQIPNRRSTSEAFVLRKQGTSYADLLRDIKDKVKAGTAAAKAIKTLRKSRDGDVIVVLDKAEDASVEDLRKEISKIPEVSVKKSSGGDNGTATLFLNNIDGVATAEEVISAVASTIGTETTNIGMSDLRESFGGNQSTTLKLPREKAQELINNKGLRIGLSWCPVRERIDVARCFRCYGYGHLGRDCKTQVDRSKLCRRCAGTDHLAKDCRREEIKCLTCMMSGHQAGSGKCPEFRKALERERAGRKNSGSAPRKKQWV